MGSMAEPFEDWLRSELEERGWSRSEAARRGGISASMFDKVINGYARPGLDFCKGVAQAFRMPLEDVFRRAGILPPLPSDAPYLQEAIELFSRLPEELQEVVLTQMRALVSSHSEVETRS